MCNSVLLAFGYNYTLKTEATNRNIFLPLSSPCLCNDIYWHLLLMTMEEKNKCHIKKISHRMWFRCAHASYSTKSELSVYLTQYLLSRLLPELLESVLPPNCLLFEEIWIRKKKKKQTENRYCFDCGEFNGNHELWAKSNSCIITICFKLAEMVLRVWGF